MRNIRTDLQKVNVFLKEANRPTFVLVLTSALILTAFLFSIAYNIIEKIDIVWYDFPSEEKDLVFLFVAGIIVAPILETWLCQTLPYTLLNKVKFLKERSYLILLISAVFFGLNHFYSLFYMIYGFLVGLIFMYGYMIRIKTDNKTYYLIVISHLLVNLVATIRNLLLE
jgi:hypothetical protein